MKLQSQHLALRANKNNKKKISKVDSMNISKLISNEEEVSDFERTNHQSYNNRRTNNKTHNDSSVLFQPDHQFQLHNK